MRKILFMFLLASVSLAAQPLPEAPVPHLDRTEWALLGADAAVRGLDTYSTWWAESAGNKEGVLPGWIANHPPVMALYSVSIVGAQYYAARKLFAHHHARIAHLVTAVDVSVTAPFAIHNLFLPVCVTPNIYTPKGCVAP